MAISCLPVSPWGQIETISRLRSGQTSWVTPPAPPLLTVSLFVILIIISQTYQCSRTHPPRRHAASPPRCYALPCRHLALMRNSRKKKKIRGRSGNGFSGSFRGNKALSKDFCEGKIPKKHALRATATHTFTLLAHCDVGSLGTRTRCWAVVSC